MANPPLDPPQPPDTPRLPIPEATDPETQVWLRLVAEQLPAVFWTTDCELRLTSGFGAGVAQLNLGPDTRLGKTMYEILGDDPAGALPLAAHAQALRGQVVKYEAAWQGRVFQSRVEPLRSPDKEIIGVIGAALDVTDQRRAEHSLQRTEARLAQAFLSSPLATALVGLECDRFLEVNEAFLRLYGGSRSDLLARRLDSFPLSHAPDLAANLRRQLSAAGHVAGREAAFVNAGGETRQGRFSAERIDAHGQTCLLLVVEDVTEDRRQGRERIAFAERIDDLVQHVPGMLFQTRGRPDGTGLSVPYISSAAQEFLGYSPQEIVDQPQRLLEAIHPDDRSAYYEAALASCAAAGPFRIELRVVSRTGDTRWLRIESRPQVLETGELLYSGLAFDISDRRSAEDALRQAKEMLGQNVHERTRDLLAANEALEREVQERRRAEAALQTERQLLQRLLNLHDRERQLISYEIHDGLIQDLVASKMLLEAAVVRWDAGAAPPRPELDQTLGFLRKSIQEGRRLISELRPLIIDEHGIVAAIEYLIAERAEAANVRILFDHNVSANRFDPLLEGALYRIVQEALNNIVRHSQASEATIRLESVGAHLWLEIADDGVGFDPDRVPSDRFGVRGIAERARLFGGQATIDTAPNRGVRITVEMPLDPPPGASPTSA